MKRCIRLIRAKEIQKKEMQFDEQAREKHRNEAQV